jgi:hypothetical protein
LQQAIWAFTGVMAPATHGASADVTTPAMTINATNAAALARIMTMIGLRRTAVNRQPSAAFAGAGLTPRQLQLVVTS